MRLNKAECGRTFYIKYVAGEKNELDRLTSLGISCGRRITILHAEKNGGRVVSTDGDPVGLSVGICKRIEVE